MTPSNGLPTADLGFQPASNAMPTTVPTTLPTVCQRLPTGCFQLSFPYRSGPLEIWSLPGRRVFRPYGPKPYGSKHPPNTSPDLAGSCTSNQTRHRIAKAGCELLTRASALASSTRNQSWVIQRFLNRRW
jgi:hypothetical protein